MLPSILRRPTQLPSFRAKREIPLRFFPHLATRHFFTLLLPPENRFSHPFHRPLRHLPRLLRSFVQNLQNALRVLFVLHSPPPHRRNPLNQMVRHLRLALDTPDPRRPATLRRPLQRRRRRKQFMPVIHGTHVRISRVRPSLPRRVRHHHFRFRANVRVALA